MHFEVVGTIEQIETIAVGGRIRDNIRFGQEGRNVGVTQRSEKPRLPFEPRNPLAIKRLLS